MNSEADASALAQFKLIAKFARLLGNTVADIQYVHARVGPGGDRSQEKFMRKVTDVTEIDSEP